MNEVQKAFSQGARCGHVEGKGRAGSYIIGEQEEVAAEAAHLHHPDFNDLSRRDAWENGYNYGYKLAAEGSALPAIHVNAPLPERR